MNDRTKKRTTNSVRTNLKQIGTIMNQSTGYARVSSIGQSLEAQMDKLKDCDKVFQEKRSGKQADNRPELLKALDYVREGDSLVISRLDRMARSVLDLAKIAQRLREKDVRQKNTTSEMPGTMGTWHFHLTQKAGVRETAAQLTFSLSSAPHKSRYCHQ